VSEARARVATAAGPGLLAALIGFYFGADAWWSLAIGAIVAAAASAALGARAAAAWRAPVQRPAFDRSGSRWDVAELAWSLRSRIRPAGPPAMDRLQRLAQRRLAERGLDVREPSHRATIEQLLGRDGYRLLTSHRTQAPMPGSYVRYLDLLDRLIRTERPTGSSDAR
jgi:hypothetical protein